MPIRQTQVPGRLHRLAWTMLLTGLIAVPADAATKSDHVQDLMLTVLARRALLDDRELGPLNLGVSVTNRVVTVWGAVPTPVHVDRAIRTLSRMADIVRVQNAMHIAADEEPVPVSSLSPPSPFALPVTLTTSAATIKSPPLSTPRSPVAAPVSDSAWQAVRPREDPRMPDHREFETVLPSLRLPTPPIVDPAALAISRTIEKSVNELRQQARFSSIDVKIKDAVVTLTGDPTPALYDFAHAVSHVPGVRRVIVKERQ